MASLDVLLKIARKEISPESLEIYIRNEAEESCVKWINSSDDTLNVWSKTEEFTKFREYDFPKFMKEVKKILKEIIKSKVFEEENSSKYGLFTILDGVLSDFYKSLQYYKDFFWQMFENQWNLSECQAVLELNIENFWKALSKQKFYSKR